MELAQVVTNALFSLPATEGYDGPVVCLRRPTDRLPGEKHVRILHPVVISLLATMGCSQFFFENDYCRLGDWCRLQMRG